MNILQLIAADSFITVNKKLIKIVGLHEALLLGIFASKQNYNNNDWFYYTQEAINDDCGLGRKPFEAALNKLIELEIIITKKEGLPAKKYYLITDKLGELLQTSMSQTDKQACPKRTNTITSTNTKNTFYNNTISTNTQARVLFDYVGFNELEIKAIEDWLEYKKEKHQTYKERGLIELKKKLLALKERGSIVDCISNCISNNWSGLFATDNKPKQNSNLKRCNSDFDIKGVF